MINCDNIITVAKTDLDQKPVDKLDRDTRTALDRAIRYSLDIIH